jgi:hypothetical protein
MFFSVSGTRATFGVDGVTLQQSLRAPISDCGAPSSTCATFVGRRAGADVDGGFGMAGTVSVWALNDIELSAWQNPIAGGLCVNTALGTVTAC